MRPRQLEVVPDEAEVVRLVFERSVTTSTAALAKELNAEGVLRRPKVVNQSDGSVIHEHQPWTRDAVKDILRRGRFYLGFVVEKRGLDERPGHHEAIIDEPTYNAYLIGARNRFRPGERPKPHRVYLLKGVIACENGHPMHGACRLSRGQEWRYYVCRKCDAPSVRAGEAERVVLDAIGEMTLPPNVIDQARVELARRLDAPQTDLDGTKRQRLEAG